MPNFEFYNFSEPSEGSQKKQSKYNYPIINGKVTLTFKGFENVIIDVYEGLFIKDVDADGDICIAGVLHRKVCESIFKEAYTMEAARSRKKSVIMLLCIKKYVQINGQVNGVVNTTFGRKYLDFGKPKRVEIPDPDIDVSGLDFDLN